MCCVDMCCSYCLIMPHLRQDLAVMLQKIDKLFSKNTGKRARLTQNALPA